MLPPPPLFVGLWTTPKRFCEANVLLRCSRGCSYLQLSVPHRQPQIRPASACLQPPHFFIAQGNDTTLGSCQGWKNTEALTAKSAVSLQEKLADHHRSLEVGS